MIALFSLRLLLLLQSHDDIAMLPQVYHKRAHWTIKTLKFITRQEDIYIQKDRNTHKQHKMTTS